MKMIPRKFDSEIRITENGEWIFRGQKITHENVLSFFKKSIREDELGIYITNSYAELTEHGYLEAKCIFLKIIDYTLKDKSITLTTEDDRVVPVAEFHFYSDKDEKFFCMIKSDRFIKFYFNRQVHSYLSNYIIEENGYYFLNVIESKIPILPYNKPIEVNVPLIT